MKYKNYTFPHEPERLEIAVKNRLGTAHCPGYGPAIQEMGFKEGVITGRGCFSGPGRGKNTGSWRRCFFSRRRGCWCCRGTRR